MTPDCPTCQHTDHRGESLCPGCAADRDPIADMTAHARQLARTVDGLIRMERAHNAALQSLLADIRELNADMRREVLP